uniref:Rho guanine nucleotide exchange factor 2-like n=1 Tax=Oncorhynchus tshawytscha TaxID=74940 RepID=A0A8C8J3G4_ONCTS
MSIEEIRCNHLLIQMPTTPSSYAHPPACLPSSSSIPPTPPNFPFPSPPCSPGPGVKGVGRAGGVTLRSPATRHLTHLDPWRRHSWEPGAIVTVQQKGMEPSDNRSVSLENLDPEEMEKVLGVALDVRRGGRDPRRNPITQEGSLSSLTEEEAGSDVQHYSILEEQSNQLQGCSASAPTLSVARHRNLQSTAPRPRSDCYETLPYRQLGGSTQSVDSDLGLLLWGREGSWTEVERDEAREERTGSPLERTFSFLRKMAGNRKNKEKERMREREKEARDREARYSNGHLFTSLTVSGTTLCSACNKSITAKEALSCPTCSVTIHNRCRDTLPNSPMMRERPSSAIYHSDNLRQSLLGSRRGRSGLSLSKSVSTNNITGNLNDDSPLGLRRILSQSTDSLNFRNRAMSMESLNDEGEEYYTSMLEEMEIEGRDFEADSWSMAVDSGYLQTHRKDIIKRQDVIYELIQTELHHVRTLRIMERVFRQGMLEEVQLEPGVVHAIFPCLDRLTAIHARFLAQLLTRRNHSLQPGSTYNFTIHQLGDVLLEQFSGQCADEMRKTYAEFCSRHLKAVKLYKELLARDKRFQYFIRRVCRGHLLRRHGVQECILLVTQRITKYPVLIQRILDNTKDNEEEASCLAQSLTQIRELLTSVDQQVMELERTQRLQEIRARLDPRAEAKVRDGGLFRGGELLRRRLIHEGMLLWKTPGSRLKDVQVLLMTDILVFLQEKDQRFIFPCLDKSPVLSLQNLMIREIANQERGLFLISDSSPPEMYEVHAASKDDKNTWIRLIQHTVRSCPSREEFPLIETEDKALLRRLKADIQQKDREVLELLQERVTLFSDLAEVTGGQEIMLPGGPNSRNLFRADMPQVPLGERLLTDAIAEGEGLVGTVIKQDSILELCLRSDGPPVDAPTTPTGRVWRSLSRDAGMAEASTGAAIGELALLQRQHSLLQEELGRLRGADGRLRDSEKARAQLERQVRDMKVHSTTVFDSVGPAGSEQVELLTGTVGSSDVEVEVTSDEEEEEEKEAKASPRSESPRGV